MKFTKLLFDKDNLKMVEEDDLKEKVVERLKIGSLEGLFVELKSYQSVTKINKKYNELAKYVTALANNDYRGGLLILGIHEKRPKLTPFKLDKNKDAIYSAITDRLLVKQPETIEVHDFASTKSPTLSYVLIEVENKETYPYYWGYLYIPSKGNYYPYVKKTEREIEKIPLDSIHKLRNLKYSLIYPQRPHFLYPESLFKHAAYGFPIYKTPKIELGVRNNGKEVISNIKLKFLIESFYLTPEEDLWIIQNPGSEEEQGKIKRFRTALEETSGTTPEIRYIYQKGGKKDIIEMEIKERGFLAQSHEFKIPIQFYVEIPNSGQASFEILMEFSSNETGVVPLKPVQLTFVNRP